MKKDNLEKVMEEKQDLAREVLREDNLDEVSGGLLLSGVTLLVKGNRKKKQQKEETGETK